MKKISIILSLVALLMASCSDFLDVNDDPNFPLEVEDYLLLPAATASISNVFSADYGLIGSYWAQHWAQNNTSSQYKTYESYAISSNSGVVNRSYRELYIGGLSDNEILLRKALADENWGVYLMAATMKAFTFQYIVDLYGNAPYSEAFNGAEGNLSPKVDDGKSIYEAIYALLNEALSKDLSGFISARYAKFDLLLGADIANWKKFANTLKLRILLRQYAANEAFAKAEITKLLAENNFLTADVSFTNFEDSDSKSNPLYESDQRQLNTQNNIRGCATFMSYLEAKGDTRLAEMFVKVDNNYRGMVPGSYNVPSTSFEAPKVVSKPKLTPLMAVQFMTKAESDLLIAEAYLRLNNAAKAKEYYESGVKSSFTRIGADIGSLLTGSYAFPATGFDAQLKAIIMQKWVDAADGQRGIEAHVERVRTGYPEESTVSASVKEGYTLPDTYVPGTLIYSKTGSTGGVFPRRFPYPDAELNYNANAAEYKALADQEVMLSKVWWNK